MNKYAQKFFFLLDAQAKKGIPLLILAFLFSSLLDVVGIGLIGIFLGLLTSPLLFLKQFSFFLFLTDSLGWTEKKIIVFSGVLIIVAFAMKAIVALIIQNRIVFFSQSFLARIKIRMMTAYQYAPYTYFLQKNSAQLISRIQDNTNGFITGVFMPILNFISNGLLIIAILVFLAILHPILTSFLILLFFSIAYIFDVVVRQRLSAYGKIAALSHGEMINSINQGLHGLTEVRVFACEDFFLNKVTAISTKYAHAVGIIIALQQIPRYLIENMIAIFIIGLSLGGIAAGYTMETVIAMVGMFAAAGARLLPSATQIIATVNQIRGYSYHLQMIYAEFVELNQLKSITNFSLDTLSSPEKNILNFSRVELIDIGYQYPNSHYAALEKVNMTILKGKSIGLIGPSGAGKSTLVNLILGFLESQQGQLLVDGKPIQHLRTWLNNFAYIPQSIFLLDDTLRRNIAFGVDDNEINEAQVNNAVQMAQLTDVVVHLSAGLDTMIGENGIRLSGGQRQRVALARAFYHERNIIILDEATSSLDNETEKEVINTIKRLKEIKTLIVIAHRLSTVEHCDVLYRLEQGRVSSVGTFKEVVGSI